MVGMPIAILHCILPTHYASTDMSVGRVIMKLFADELY